MSDCKRVRGEQAHAPEPDDLGPPPSYHMPRRRLFREGDRQQFNAGDRIRLGGERGLPAVVLSVCAESVLVRWECDGATYTGAWDRDDLFNPYAL